ncbi:retrovirus-related Pol polyprotein from transposon 297 [Trichonephila clavipes]|nr:retrovirus-related Pol polyprotein from transposon 297 [Trichonephila clavipes]
MIRWALKLSEFNIEWEHRPGVQNVVAHLLSRNPVDSVEGSQISCAALRALAINSREQFIKEQREDPELGHIYRYLENPDDGSVNATRVTELRFLLISDNGPQFISDVFEHLSHRLDIKHMKTVTYRPQSNLTERVNRNLVQMIASFVEENHENWDQFLHEFAFALRTAVNETTNKTPAELFLGRKIITPFSKLINVTDDAKYVGVESIAGPSRLPDRRTATTTGGSRMEVSGRDNQTRQTRTTTRGRNEQAEKPVRSNQTNTRRPCPYYLRSRIQEKDGIPEELNNIEINGIPGNTFRRRSLSMEALDGDPVHRI